MQYKCAIFRKTSKYVC